MIPKRKRKNRRYHVKNNKRSDNLYETKKKIRKEAVKLFAHAGNARRADAGDGPDGVCGVKNCNMEWE